MSIHGDREAMHKRSLMMAGERLMPCLAALLSARREEEDYEEKVRALWCELRGCWAAWWPLRSVPEAPGLWTAAAGTRDAWEWAGASRLLSYWMNREEPPYQITHEELSFLERWLYGAAWVNKGGER